MNDAIASAGSNAIGQMVDTANSSIEKRRRNKEIRAKREAEEKAAKEGGSTVRPRPLLSNLFNLACYVLMIINKRRAESPDRLPFRLVT